jgi:protein-tyrosine phosphatase
MAIAPPRPARHLDLEGPVNVRDLGGYQGRAGQTLRWHRLLRADDLSRATEADRVRLGGLGVVTIIDLRTDREHAAARLPVLRGVPVQIHHLPMVRDGWDPSGPVAVLPGAGADDLLAQRSLDMLVEGAPAIADALRILAQPGAQPAVIHSALGKDRAGLLAAVVLALLGVATEVIAEDYARSELVLARDEQRRCADGTAGRVSPWADPTAVAAPPGAMVRVLEQVNRRCGSMVGFARGIGVEFEVIEALHRQLLV